MLLLNAQTAEELAVRKAASSEPHLSVPHSTQDTIWVTQWPRDSQYPHEWLLGWPQANRSDQGWCTKIQSDVLIYGNQLEKNIS